MTQGPRPTRACGEGRDGDMGRGRQKAKDAKIARQLKYANHGADLRDLEKELISRGSGPVIAVPPVAHAGQADDSDDYYDRWADDDD